ncbi:glycerophosphodiester phosphodiesterase family protein [Nocardioides sp.]|uniref:glycerophosphodiester phosphodiesterase n=1 Tax=Nocardioides sp. TaxID=35761 RepID=UPI00286DCC84|nr:glycerophosphodiester phosphodiesterase family protein [Nocardioides sp.]
MFVRRLVALVSLLTIASGLTSGPAFADPDFTLTAHRGAPTRTLGENTLPAFGRALSDGATAIETDLRRTKDDKLVVLHDSGVGRTTDCTGPIGSWTLRDLLKECREDTSAADPHRA